MTKYSEIFNKIEQTIKEESSLSQNEFELQFGKFKKFENTFFSDDEIFKKLTMIVFYSGFSSSVVEKKEKIILNHFPNYKTVINYSKVDSDRISSDPKMIKNINKINACIKNAFKFNSIIKKFGSFNDYLNSFNANESYVNFFNLKEELTKFSFIGETTVYHFMSDIGFNVLKPDRVILRIFKRLGLIENDNKLSAIKQGQIFAKETNLPIRYIDIIIVKYGQSGESYQFGLKDGICLENNPKCYKCNVIQYCNYN